MRTFDVQAIGIEAPRDCVFEFVAEPSNLPKWGSAFKSADKHSARLQTPQGTAEIALGTDACRDTGTVDWTMTFPDGSVGHAYSRVTPAGRTDRCSHLCSWRRLSRWKPWRERSKCNARSLRRSSCA